MQAKIFSEEHGNFALLNYSAHINNGRAGMDESVCFREWWAAGAGSQEPRQVLAFSKSYIFQGKLR